MNDQLRRVFSTALGDTEPPSTTTPSELAGTGRRKQRNRRIGLVVSGTGFTVAVVAAAALLLPGTFGGTTGEDDSTRDAVGDTTQDAAPADLPALSKQVRSAMKGAFPEVSFTMASGWNVGDKPFDLTQEGTGGMPYLVGYGNVKGDGHELVGVELYPPGDWSTKAGTGAGGDSDADEFLIDCGSQEEPTGTVTATCDSRELRDGSLLRIGKVVEKSNNGEIMGVAYTAVSYRADDTAVVLRTACYDEETDCDKDEFDTVAEDAVEHFLVFAPKIPESL